MTHKQRLFVRHMIQTGNQSESARLAGYSPKTAGTRGSALMRIDEIRAAVEKGQALQSQNLIQQAADGVDRLNVLDGLIREANATGKGTTHAARVSAWRAIGEDLGMFGKATGATDADHLQAIQIRIIAPDGSAAEVTAGKRALPEGEGAT